MMTFFAENRISTDSRLSESLILQERDLIDRLCQANEEALETLYHLYYARIYRFVARIVRRDDIIDEVINDVMYTVWQKASTYDHSCKLSTWIFGIAFNKARHALRSESQYDEESLDDLEEDNILLGADNMELKKIEIADWMSEGLSKLSAEHRAVIELTYFEGLHYSEIAVIMNCPENTVKTRMHHARKNLALFLSDWKNN